uniref:Uncharacterized protein n=1 Tax=Oryza rufipogon TaxID=4529 RepID=A0A0E0N526_ORYRU
MAKTSTRPRVNRAPLHRLRQPKTTTNRQASHLLSHVKNATDSAVRSWTELCTTHKFRYHQRNLL